MKDKKPLPSTFNISLGFIPIVISLFLCSILTQETAIYIGTSIGVIWSLFSLKSASSRVLSFILYLSTGILLLCSLSTLIPDGHIPPEILPITLEISILSLLFIVYIPQKRLIKNLLKKFCTKDKALLSRSFEATLVSVKITLLLGGLHLLSTIVLLLFLTEIPSTIQTILYQIIPSVIFTLIILLNQSLIWWFNKIMVPREYVPIVDTHGSVIGKRLATEVPSTSNDYIHPIIRIIPYTDEMIYLCERSSEHPCDFGKTDIPMEYNLHYGESLSDGVARLLHEAFPNTSSEVQPEFNILYHLKDEEVNRLVYLFFVHIENEITTSHPFFKNCKLWCFHQIEENIGKNYFSRFFEEEYEHIKTVIYTKGKYKAL